MVVGSQDGETYGGDGLPRAHPDGNGSCNVEQGSREIAVVCVRVTGEISGAEFLQVGEKAILSVDLLSSVSAADVTVGFAIRDDCERLVFGTNTRLLGNAIVVTPGRYTVAFSFPNDLGLGQYSVTVMVHKGESHLLGCFHMVERAHRFVVVEQLGQRFEGRVRLRVETWIDESNVDGAITFTPVEDPSLERFALLGRRNPALTQFSARMEALGFLPALPRASEAILNLRITNSGPLVWTAFGKRAVSVSYHWLSRSGTVVEFEGLRTNLPYDVKPGATVEIACFFPAPECAGPMTLLWTLVQEDVAWFNDQDPDSCVEIQADVV